MALAPGAVALVGKNPLSSVYIKEHSSMFCSFIFRLGKNLVAVFSVAAILLLIGLTAGCGGGQSTPMPTATTGTINVSLSDPPSCMPPNGNYAHVWITVISVRAHTDPNVDPNSSPTSAGWQELAPQLASQPKQIDLFSSAQTTCILAQLGSNSLPVGTYQQIRLMLLDNSPASGAALPSSNACAGNGYNCVILKDTSVHEIDLSSQAQTGLKIPPGQIVGGPITVSAGQSVDLNIDFNACASIVPQGNGQYRLKPTLTAGQVGPNTSGIGGQVVDSITKAPIAGTVLVAIEQPDSGGVDRIVMEMAADSNGNFRFCPLPTGTFDIVIDAVGPNNLPYNATAVVNVPNGTNLNTVPLVAETGATAPAVLQGFITASTSSGGANAPFSVAALQTVSVSGANRQLTIPLESIAATSTSSAVTSTGTISVSDSTGCPAGSPAGANCAQYTLVVPASNPSVGIFNASGVSYAAPAAGDVLFTVDANAPAGDCSKSEIITSTDINNQPLKVTAATTTDVARTDFTGCS